MIEDLARTILAEHGMTGRLDKIAGAYHLRGEVGAKGCSIAIDGVPDEAFLRLAAPIMRDRIADEWRSKVDGQ